MNREWRFSTYCAIYAGSALIGTALLVIHNSFSECTPCAGIVDTPCHFLVISVNRMQEVLLNIVLQAVFHSEVLHQQHVNGPVHRKAVEKIEALKRNDPHARHSAAAEAALQVESL